MSDRQMNLPVTITLESAAEVFMLTNILRYTPHCAGLKFALLPENIGYNQTLKLSEHMLECLMAATIVQPGSTKPTGGDDQ